MREIVRKILNIVEEVCYAISFFSAFLWMAVFWLGDGVNVGDVVAWISYCVPPFIFAYILRLKKESVGNMIFNKFNFKKKIMDAKQGFKDIANIANVVKGKEPISSQSTKTTEHTNQQSNVGTIAAVAAVGAGVATAATAAQSQTNQSNQDFSKNLSQAKDNIADKIKSEKESDNDDDESSEDEEGGFLGAIFDDDE